MGQITTPLVVGLTVLVARVVLCQKQEESQNQSQHHLVRRQTVDPLALYDFLTDDANAINSGLVVFAQSFFLSLVLSTASIAYTAFRGSAISTDLDIAGLVKVLTSDEEAAKNILVTMGYAVSASLAWIFFSQLGEPTTTTKKRVGEQENKQDGWLSIPNLVDRQGGFDIFGILDGALNYGIILRTIVLNIIASSSFIAFWVALSLLPDRATSRKRRSLPRMADASDYRPANSDFRLASRDYRDGRGLFGVSETWRDSYTAGHRIWSTDARLL